MPPLAHGSGIDDALIVLLPLAIVIVMLRLGAKKMPPEEADATGDAARSDAGDAREPSDPADPTGPAAGPARDDPPAGGPL